MTKQIILSKVIKPHMAKCSAVKRTEEGVYNTPWSPEEIKTEWRDKACGKRGNNTAWLIFGCKDNSCRARVAILANAILKLGELGE